MDKAQLERWFERTTRHLTPPLAQMRAGRDSSLPAHLLRYRDAPAYYGVLHDALAGFGLGDERIADVAIRQEAAIEQYKITDWQSNLDVQNEMRRALDDIFFEVEASAGALIEAEPLGLMIEQVIEVAKARSGGHDGEAP